ncbi:MAG: nucleotide exchange factor GrpE [Eubacteriales bacterium]|nr:nucleotide exchange factor GrpE [Eubacteriales bacterium]
MDNEKKDNTELDNTEAEGKSQDGISEKEVKTTEDTEEKAKDANGSEQLSDELSAKDKEIAELKDKYLRLAAEYDNFRKRSSKERDGIYTDAVSDTVKEILPVIDNLERASLYSDAKNVAEGLKLTAKGAAAMLAKLGITEFAKEGEHFDPTLHNAVMHVEDEEHGEGVIVEVFQKGYRRGDKIIRYAMVKVAN